MRTVESTTRPTERETALTALEGAIVALFAQLPMLSGFSVQDPATLTRDREMAALDADLSIADLSVHAWTSLEAKSAARNEIVRTLRDLVDEHPGTRDLLGGSTFARTFH